MQIEYSEQDLKATMEKLKQLKSQQTSLQKVMLCFDHVMQLDCGMAGSA